MDSEQDDTATSGSDAIIAAAHLARSRGWRVIKIHFIGPDGVTCSCKDGANCKPQSKGKHPVDGKWEQTPEQSGADVQAMFEGTKYQIGALTGAPSGIFVVDFDGDEGTKSFTDLAEQHGKWTPTRVHRTGSGGYHLIYRHPGFQVKNSVKTLAPGVDIRGDGGQIVLPPSRNASGQYEVVRDVEPADAPDWLITWLSEQLTQPVPEVDQVEVAKQVEALEPAERQRVDTYARDVVIKPELARLRECAEKGWNGPPWNHTTFQVACVLIQLANSPWTTFTVAQAHRLLLGHAPTDKGFGPNEHETCWRSAVKSVGSKIRPIPGKPKRSDDDWDAGGARLDSRFYNPDGSPKDISEAGPTWIMRTWDDMGNAQRMVDHFRDQLRYVPERDSWAFYEGGRWQIDTSNKRTRTRVHQLIDALPTTEALLYSNVVDNVDDPKSTSPRQEFEKWIKAQRMSARISACLDEAKARPEFLTMMADFDANPMILNVRNGYIDLTTGILHKHDPSKLLMQQAPVDYDPHAPSPLWDRYLVDVQPNPEMRYYLQTIVGYSLTGSTAEQAMFIHYGPKSNNGKSVFLRIMAAMLGDYNQVISKGSILSSGREEHPTGLARMIGKRFLQCEETKPGQYLEEEVVKGLTGQAPITARFMGQDFFDYTPTGKIHLISNHLPRMSNAEAIWRRTHLVGWKVHIPVEKRDLTLADRMIATELPGILRWAVQGTLAWLKQGALVRPGEAWIDVSEYRIDQDEFGDFIREKCTVMDPSIETSIYTLHASYGTWCWKAGLRHPMKIHDFARVLTERDFKVRRDAKQWLVSGLSLDYADISPVNNSTDSFFEGST